jgi:hypothetical protein
MLPAEPASCNYLIGDSDAGVAELGRGAAGSSTTSIGTDLPVRARGQLPGCVAEPLRLRGRVIGLLLCVGTPIGSLTDIAKQGAAALELANDYTDFIEAARRHKPTSPAAEIQQSLFPPRIARLAGAQLAGVLLPSYDVGGDWFDFVENRDGAWIAIADAAGKGPTAAGLGAAALGALRAARRDGSDPTAARTAMAIQQAVTDCWREPLEDDGTVVVMAVG